MTNFYRSEFRNRSGTVGKIKGPSVHQSVYEDGKSETYSHRSRRSSSTSKMLLKRDKHLKVNLRSFVAQPQPVPDSESSTNESFTNERVKLKKKQQAERNKLEYEHEKLHLRKRFKIRHS